MNIESKTSPRHWRIEDILLYLNNNVKKTTAEKILHSILISSDILTWNPQGEIVYHGRDIPGTNIENLLQYALLPYNSHIPEPRGLDLFTKGLVEAGVNKDLIKNEYLLSKMAKEEYEMPQSDSDVESESGEEDRKSDKSDNESEYDDDDGDDNEEDDNDDDNEDDDESEKLACNHCGEETGHIVYLMKCQRCSWKDLYGGKDGQCMICDEQSPLLFSHVIGFCELFSYGTSNSKAGGVEFTPKMDK
jgi:hypothetical protein